MPPNPPELKSNRLLLRMGQPEDIPAILRYYSVNKPFLEPFEPTRPDNFYTYEFWEAALTFRDQEFHSGEAVKLFIFKHTEPLEVIGIINLNTIIRGAFHGATLGYGLAASHQRQGVMTEAGQRLIDYAFQELNLHRIMAGYMPHNHRSGNVLKRLGFQIEGVARDYLFINGGWQDHILTSLLNPHWQGHDS
jgi:ribosomal-protein-alanine N-acetyltransferase